MAEDPLSNTIAAVADKLAKAAEGLVTVEVRTLIGSAALAGNAGNDDIQVPQGTEGAYTACNMATGDIIACYSDKVAASEQARELHEQAVELGTRIFNDNVELLKRILLELIDKQRAGGG